jgi:thiol:disulfide interchange protein/DsbC/DsbD-like thiol-disulfide interchange protein
MRADPANFGHGTQLEPAMHPRPAPRRFPQPAACGVARFALLALVAGGWSGVAGAAASPEVRTDHLVSRLVAETGAAVPGQPLRLGLLLDHDPHWHTYWTNPGDSGLPTRIEWTLPAGVRAGDIDWPLPTRFPLGPVVNFGYEGRTLLPVTLEVPAGFAADSLEVEAHASWLVCQEECIPGEARYRLVLPVAATAAPSAWADSFASADRRRPQPAADGLRAVYEVGERAVVLRLAGSLPDGIERWEFFPATPEVVENAVEPEWRREGDGYVLELARSTYYSRSPERFEVVLRDGERGLAFAAVPAGAAAGVGGVTTAATDPAPVADVRAAPRGSGAPPSLALALGLALLGGLILNLMPCVFPVLSMKALGAVEAAGDRRALRRHGLLYAAGVVTSFLAIAALLLALRRGGEQLGWGFQLQEPWFVAAIALLLFAMALGFSGLAEFGGRLAGLGGRLAAGGGDRAAFFTGVLACVVASPCTAPFMGTALGFALTQPPGAALAVFAALGLGLALPMLALGFVPALARLLPRPGPWMQTFRQLLAFPLYLTVVWLVWVYGEQTSPLGMAQLLVALTGLAFALWLWPRVPRRAGAARLAAQATALAVLVASIAWPLLARPPVAATSASTPNSTAALHEPWTAERLAALRAEGRPVLVNMTAAWCITCLANERVALSSQAFADALAARNVAYLKGDWTRRDPAITAYLEDFGRSGVPLYVLYPARGEPEVLPQILTGDLLEQALARL